MSEAPARPAEARYVRINSLLDEWDADADARAEARKTGQPLGPMTGLVRLDAALGSALEPGLHQLHGNTGVGKTAFALQVAASCGCPCLYVSCEMRALELLRRITARVTSTFLGKFKSGELAPEQSRLLVRQAAKATPALALLDATVAPASAKLIGDRAVLNKVTSSGDNADAPPHHLIIIDSLNSWAEGAYPGVPEYEQLNTALAALREVAALLACPILIINERNRSGMEKGGVNSGAGSRKIEYGAESVLDLDREKDKEGKPLPEDASGEVSITLRIGKNRNGTTGKPMELKFNGALQRYKETLF